MIRKLTAILAAALVLGGCATGGYGYQGGGGGDYYYDRSNAGYHDGYGYGYDGYGYDRYGYGGYGYAPSYYGGYYGASRPYYPYYPHRSPTHRPDRPRTVVVPNKRLPGFDYPPGATRYPNRPGGVRGPLTVHTSPGAAVDGGSRVRRTEVPTRSPGQAAGPSRQSVAVPAAPVRSAPRPTIRESRPDAPQPRMRSTPARPASGSRVRSQDR